MTYVLSLPQSLTLSGSSSSLAFSLFFCPSVPWGSYYNPHLWAWFTSQPYSLSRAHYYCITVCPAAPGERLTTLTDHIRLYFLSGKRVAPYGISFGPFKLQNCKDTCRNCVAKADRITKHYLEESQLFTSTFSWCVSYCKTKTCLRIMIMIKNNNNNN